jgi:DNA-binding GntR family transcriptional regulator
MGSPQPDDAPVLDRIRAKIVNGEFMPGDLLAETRLAEQLDVSRTPIREAFKQLKIEGLIEIRPRVGTFVRKPTQREVIELFQLKESLEGLAANLLTRRGHTEDLELLIDNVQKEKDAVAAGDRQAYSELVHHFHTTLVRGADNQKLSVHYDLLMNQLAYQQIVQQTIRLPGRLEDSLSEHEKIVNAIQMKDPLMAELIARRHVVASGESASVAAFHELQNQAAAD